MVGVGAEERVAGMVGVMVAAVTEAERVAVRVEVAMAVEEKVVAEKVVVVREVVEMAVVGMAAEI